MINETRTRKIKRQVYFWFPIKRQVNTENSRQRKQPINNHSKEKLKSNATNQDKKAHWLRQKRNDNTTFDTKTKDMTPPLKKI